MESSSHSPVAPVRPVAPYVGGKKLLASRLTALISTIPHKTYAEPFVGMGGVFLRRPLRPRSEVVNDLSGDVANLFRILQRHYPQLMDVMRFGITSRAEFERLKASDPATLTDLERAARFIYLQVTAFGGKVVGRNFGVSVGSRGGFDVNRLGPLLEAVHDRLSGVTVEQLPFDAFLERYDRPETLFYCDPPYWGTEGFYGRALFARDRFELLAGKLQALQGRFILSINDVPEIRELFAWADIEPVGLTYGLQGGAKEARELIITSPGTSDPKGDPV